jgi:hypothetical protein
MPASEARAVGHARAGRKKRFGRLNRFNERNMQLYDAAVNNKFFAGFAGGFHPPFSPMHPFSAGSERLRVVTELFIFIFQQSRLPPARKR